MAGLLQRAWDWLAPPEVPVVDGKLVKRARRLPQPSVQPLMPPSVPPAQAALGFAAPLLVRPDAAQPPAAQPPAAFVHPLANHELQLAGVAVGYLLERSRRRSIGMTVSAEGLRVRAPLGVGHGAVERVLKDKAEWIVRKLAEQQQRSQQLHSARIAWGLHAQLPYLGQLLGLQLRVCGPRQPAVLLPAEAGPVLQLPLPPGASADQIRTAVHAWWLAQARSHFTERLNHFAPQLGVHWRSLRLSSARTRWGSARSDGSIRLNWRLMHYAPEVIDYVVVHELSHLRHMDHSPRFWATVASVLPDYRRLRQQLRDQPAPLWTDDDH